MTNSRPVVPEEDDLVACSVSDLRQSADRRVLGVGEGENHVTRHEVTCLDVVTVSIEHVNLIGRRMRDLFQKYRKIELLSESELWLRIKIM